MPLSDKLKRWLFYYIDDPDGQITGGGRSVCNLILGLRENRGIDPLLVAQCEGSIAYQLKEEGVPVRIAPLPDPLDVYDKKALQYSLTDKARALRALFRYNRTIEGIAREYGADGIWARGTRGVLQVGLAAWWAETSLVWDIGVEQSPRGIIWILQSLSLLLADKVVLQADTQSNAVFGRFISAVGSGKLRAIHPGISATRVSRIREAASRSSGAGKRLISVASVHPRKNQMMTLRAFERIHRDHPDAQLDLVGPIKDESYSRRLRRFVHTHSLNDKVHVLGWRDDIPDLLARSVGLLLSSRREGIPHVIREAMFAEVPVIATAVGGVPEAIEDGETGYLVPPDGTDEMAGRIDDLLARPEEQRRMGRKGYQLARQRFSREAWLSKYATALHELSDDIHR